METIIAALPKSFVGLAVVLITFYFGYPFFRNILEKKRYWDMKERQISMINEHANLRKIDPNSPYIEELESIIDQISSLANRYRPLNVDEILPAWKRILGCFIGFFSVYFLTMCTVYLAGFAFPSFWQVVFAWAAMGALIAPSAIWIETNNMLRATIAGSKVFGAVLLVAVLSFAIGQYA